LVTVLILGPLFWECTHPAALPYTTSAFLKGKMGMDTQDQSLKFETGVTTDMGRVTLGG
jgi:hypothetical protein